MQLMYPNSTVKTGIVICVFLIACNSKKELPKQTGSPASIVDVIIAEPSKINNIIEANGTVVAYESVELHPEISGRLTFLNVPEGSTIQKGTVMAKMNDADLQAQINKTNVQLELAIQTEERLRKLLTVNGINQADYDAALNQVNSYKADIAYTQALIDKTIIRAPFSGVVGLKQVSPGAYVTPATVIATLQQLDKIKVDFTLPEEYSSFIKKGNKVEVEVQNGQQIKDKALIIATEPQISQSTRNIKVRAILEKGKGNPGAFVKVYINNSNEKSAIKVPSNAIIPDDKNNQVILVKGGKASFVNVQTGVREASTVEITKGINTGDSVVVTGVLFARPKSQLKVRSVKILDQLNDRP